MRTILPKIDPNARIAIYARISTDEQRQQSIDDQIRVCRQHLESTHGCQFPNIIVITDEGISGEIQSRPGIDELRRLIEEGLVDEVITEDSSRFYRSMRLCDELVSLAVDNDIRVICINDRVDTADDDWQQRLTYAQQHHSRDNEYTRYRIKRAHDGLWQMGAAIGPLVPGYKRSPRENGGKRPPKFDEVDQNWAPLIVKAFEMIADGTPAQIVAVYLTENGVRKASNAQQKDWSATNVIRMIRNPKYRGHERFRVTVSRKRYVTGRSVSERNPNPDTILERDMPHLRIVDDELWGRANCILDQRITYKDQPRGKHHPVHGIPRNARGPLSGLFVCGICGAQMSMAGRTTGGYRCSGAAREECWNRVTALQQLTHQRIGAAVSDAILGSIDLTAEPLLRYLEDLVRGSGEIEELEQQLACRSHDLQRRKDRFLKFIESLDRIPPFINEQIHKLEAEESEISRERKQLQRRKSRQVVLPSREELIQMLRDAAERLSLCRRETAPLLQHLLVGPIRAIPCQQFGSAKVVMRAEFTLQLIQFLPDDLRNLMDSKAPVPESLRRYEKTITLDLFDPSGVPELALKAISFVESCPGPRPPKLRDVAAHLGTNVMMAKRALDLGRKLRAAQLTDPYVPLTERPARASRWRLERRA